MFKLSMAKIIFILFISAFLISCNSEILPKPKSYLKLQYPKTTYNELNADCPFLIEISNYATVDIQENCWMSINYPTMNAKVHITYRKVDNNLMEILKEIEKLTFEHTVKADAIPDARPYEDFNKKVYAKLYNIEGNVATNIQFRVTDSINHVLAGALYFYAKPNYDSIMPAVKYIENDIIHLVETLNWK